MEIDGCKISLGSLGKVMKVGLLLMGVVEVAPALAAEKQATIIEEVIVQARRRDERVIDVPIAISSFTGELLDKRGVEGLLSMAGLVPSLSANTNGAGFSGGIQLRGVSSGSASAFIDQAVSINVDGIPVSYSGIVKLGQFDLAQVDVLKGPQALYFGKNASGGVIALKSADPTSEFETKFRVSNEFEGDEVGIEAVISGPVSDTLGARLAIRYDDSKGLFKNSVPREGLPQDSRVTPPPDSRAPGEQALGLRGTLVYEPSDNLMVRFKAAYQEEDGRAAIIGQGQRVYCPNGDAGPNGAVPGVDDCKASTRYAMGGIDPAIRALHPSLDESQGAKDVEQLLLSADVEYDLSDSMALTSTTGYYEVDVDDVDQFSAAPISNLVSAGLITKRTFSQEFRINTDFESQVNGMLGVFFQDDEHTQRSRSAIANLAPFVLLQRASNPFRINSTAWSAFGELRWDITPELELSGGIRYSHEKRKAEASLELPNGLGWGETVDLTDNLEENSLTFTDWSPEFTLAWHPADNWMLFGSYRQGFKSGGFHFNGTRLFNASPTNPTDQDYDQETVEGFEGGIKAELLDGQMQLGLTGFYYEYEDLQLSNFDPVTRVTSIDNVAGSENSGFELDVKFLPAAVPGLWLDAAVTYVEHEYVEFFGACYTGQTQAQGCNIDLTGNGTGDLQDHSGSSLPKAPELSATFAAVYERAISDRLVGRISGSSTFFDSFVLLQEAVPDGGTSDSVWRFDAAVSVGAADGAWLLELIGRNLTNKMTSVSAFQTPLTGNSALTGTNIAGGQADLNGYVSRPKQIWLRLTFRPEIFSWRK
ncbi:MAG: TonB-dependent receptor [Pseudomonadales bacterium]|nr:TonB-dependent receptor [Pseudomonadales bacterium]